MRDDDKVGDAVPVEIADSVDGRPRTGGGTESVKDRARSAPADVREVDDSGCQLDHVDGPVGVLMDGRVRSVVYRNPDEVRLAARTGPNDRKVD